VTGCSVLKGDNISALVFESSRALIKPGISFYVSWEIV
jgi:hypothetical protein